MVPTPSAAYAAEPRARASASWAWPGAGANAATCQTAPPSSTPVRRPSDRRPIVPPGGSGVPGPMPAAVSAAVLATARWPPRRASTGLAGAAMSSSAPVGSRFSARLDSCHAIVVMIQAPGAASRAAAATVAVNSAMLCARFTGTSSVLRLASIRRSWESAKAGSRVRSPASVVTVPAPARPSSPSGSAEVATIPAPRKPTARYISPVMEWIARARISRSRLGGLVCMMVTFPSPAEPGEPGEPGARRRPAGRVARRVSRPWSGRSATRCRCSTEWSSCAWS